MVSKIAEVFSILRHVTSELSVILPNLPHTTPRLWTQDNGPAPQPILVFGKMDAGFRVRSPRFGLCTQKAGIHLWATGAHIERFWDEGHKDWELWRKDGDEKKDMYMFKTPLKATQAPLRDLKLDGFLLKGWKSKAEPDDRFVLVNGEWHPIIYPKAVRLVRDGAEVRTHLPCVNPVLQ